jgi:hypothetical protein
LVIQSWKTSQKSFGSTVLIIVAKFSAIAKRIKSDVRETKPSPTDHTAGEAMKWRCLARLSGLLLLSACAQHIPKPESNSIDLRLLKLEERVESLERLYALTPSHPLRSRAEIEERIQSLEAERSKLLEQYQSEPPYVRDITLRLRLLKSRLEMLDQGQTPTK